MVEKTYNRPTPPYNRAPFTFRKHQTSKFFKKTPYTPFMVFDTETKGGQEARLQWFKRRHDWILANPEKLVSTPKRGFVYLDPHYPVKFKSWRKIKPKPKVQKIKPKPKFKISPNFKFRSKWDEFQFLLRGPIKSVISFYTRKYNLEFDKEEEKKKREEALRPKPAEYSQNQLIFKDWVIGELERIASSHATPPPFKKFIFEQLTPPEIKQVFSAMKAVYPFLFENEPLFYIRLINLKKIFGDVERNPRKPFVKLVEKPVNQKVWKPGQGWIITPEGRSLLENSLWNIVMDTVNECLRQRANKKRLEESLEKKLWLDRRKIYVTEHLVFLLKFRFFQKYPELLRLQPTSLFSKLLFPHTGYSLQSTTFTDPLRVIEQFRLAKRHVIFVKKYFAEAINSWNRALKSFRDWKFRTLEWPYFTRSKNPGRKFDLLSSGSENIAQRLLFPLTFFASQEVNYRFVLFSFDRYFTKFAKRWETLKSSEDPSKWTSPLFFFSPKSPFPSHFRLHLLSRFFPKVPLHRNSSPSPYFPISPLRVPLKDHIAHIKSVFTDMGGTRRWEDRLTDFLLDKLWEGASPHNRSRGFRDYESRKFYWKVKNKLLNFFKGRFFRRPSFYLTDLKLPFIEQYFPRLFKTRAFRRIPRLFFTPFKPFSPLILRLAKNRYKVESTVFSFLRQLSSGTSLKKIVFNSAKSPANRLLQLRKLITNFPVQYLSRDYSLLPFLGKASDGDYREPFKYPKHPKFQRVYLSNVREDKRIQPLYNYWSATHYPKFLNKSGFFERQLARAKDPVERIGGEKISSGLVFSPFSSVTRRLWNPFAKYFGSRLYGRFRHIRLSYSHRIQEFVPNQGRSGYSHYKDWKLEPKERWHDITIDDPRSPNFQRRIFELAEFGNPQERVYRSQYGHPFAPRPRGSNASLIARRFLQLFQGTRIGGFAEEGREDPDLGSKKEPIIDLLGYKYARLLKGRYDGSVKYLSQRSLFRYINPPKIYWKDDNLLYAGHLAKKLTKRFKTVKNSKLNFKTRAADEVFKMIGNIFQSRKFRKFRLFFSSLVPNKPFPRKLSFKAWYLRENKYWSKPAPNLSDDDLETWEVGRNNRKTKDWQLGERSKLLVDKIIFPLYQYIRRRVYTTKTAKFKLRFKKPNTPTLPPLSLIVRIQRLYNFIFKYKIFPQMSSHLFFWGALEKISHGRCIQFFKVLREKLRKLFCFLFVRFYRYSEYLTYLASHVGTRFRSMTIREGEIIPFEEKLIKIGSVLERFRTRVANRLLSKKRSRHPMLIVNTAKNNIFLTVTDYVGRVLTRVSGGSISYMGSKFEGKKRSTAHATYQSTAALIRWFAKKKIKKIQLFFKCRRDYHTREVIRALENLSSEVYLKVSQVHIRFRYPFSHGPRPKRKRYV